MVLKGVKGKPEELQVTQDTFQSKKDQSYEFVIIKKKKSSSDLKKKTVLEGLVNIKEPVCTLDMKCPAWGTTIQKKSYLKRTRKVRKVSLLL